LERSRILSEFLKNDPVGHKIRDDKFCIAEPSREGPRRFISRQPIRDTFHPLRLSLDAGGNPAQQSFDSLEDVRFHLSRRTEQVAAANTAAPDP
jgi:hypothetical protein